ncbi:MAG TPA: hypothetical protein VI389_09205 [Geobacteraceae bacterium]
MKRLLARAGLILVTTLFFGCAQNYYNIPRETYEKKVRVLGVAPIMVDAASDIKHPEKEQLVSVIGTANRLAEKDLVARLKDTGVYFSVGLLDDGADQLFSRLFFRRERRDDAGIVYNKYFYKNAELKELMAKNTLDAVMLVVVSGLTSPEKVYSSNYFSYLQGDYNHLIVTAQILDADGNILWEYPNFRARKLSFTPLFALQYPDFDEAEANATDVVEVKFKTIPGITRAFGKKETSPVLSNLQVPLPYVPVLDDMVSMLGPEKRLFGSDKKQEKKTEKTPEAAPEPKPEAKPVDVKTEEIKPATVAPDTGAPGGK